MFFVDPRAIVACDARTQRAFTCVQIGADRRCGSVPNERGGTGQRSSCESF